MLIIRQIFQIENKNANNKEQWHWLNAKILSAYEWFTAINLNKDYVFSGVQSLNT